MEQFIITLLSILIGPIFVLFSLILFLASIGKSIGVRKKYVQLLIKIFEWGQAGIDHQWDSEDYENFRESNSDTAKKKILDKDEDSNHLIEREISLGAQGVHDTSSVETRKHEFELNDVMPLCKSGIESIIEDDVTRCFTAEELTCWNFLSRNHTNYQYINTRLTILWWLGLIFRYCFLLPFRMTLAIVGIGWLLVSTAFIGYLPKSRFKEWLNKRASLMCYRVLARGLSACITFHNRENIAKDGICVANHTSPIDVVILATDNCYAMVGQSHGGFLGLVQRAMNRATSHIWFERSEMKDRQAVASRLRQHVSDPSTLPMLIFPEGTCINNTSVMMFKKGSFEVGGTIYPVAIKYDPHFSDTFWNSGKQSMVKHIFLILSSWAIVCDVWYLPAETRKDGEDATMFANRVKSIIASKGGLVDLEWDGSLKRSFPKAQLKEKQQQEYSKLIKID